MKKLLLILFLMSTLLSGCAAKPAGENHAADGRVIIALLDTGVSTTAVPADRILPGWNYVTDSADTEDRINHGTAVASLILGCESAKVEPLAPDSYIVPLVVTDKTETTQSVSPEELAEAVRDSIDRYGADIICMSLGMRTDNKELRDAIAYAEEQGITVVSSVGNGGNNAEIYYPAAYDTVLAVGSHNKEGEVSTFSQKNGTARILAPGEDIWMASRNGKTYGARGTSYATAYAAAAAANLLITDPTMTSEQIRQSLFKSATDIGAPGFDESSGWGLLNMVPAP